MAVTQIIFDFGGVLVEWDPQDIVEQTTADRELQEQILTQVLRHPDWLELDRGTLTEHEAAVAMSARSGLSTETIFKVFSSVRQCLSPIDKTVQWLEHLTQQGVACYGLSNMSVVNYDYLRQTYRFFNCFKGTVVSAAEKIIKPDAEIYRLICERYTLDPTETLFIDDTPVNCQAARSIGMYALDFKRDQIDIADIQQFLVADF